MTQARKRSLTQWIVLMAVAALSGVAASSMGGVFAQETTATEESAPADPAPVAACSLLTEAEAEAALGTKVSRLDDPGQCTFVASDGSGRTLGIAIPQGMPGSEHFAAGMEQLASVASGKLRAVAAGDEGYIVFSSYFSEGMARSAEAYVAVVLTGSRGNVDEQAATITDLLNTALTRR